MSTLILGASEKTTRYSYKATKRLLDLGEDVILIGGREGEVLGVKIQTNNVVQRDIHTVTVYLSSHRQEEYIDFILDIVKPKRIIFNPGAENLTFASRAIEEGIEVLHACTLVMLATGQY